MNQVLVLLPLLIVILIGFLSGRFGLVRMSSVSVYNKFLFFIAIPALVFLSVLSIDRSIFFLFPKFIGVNLLIIFILSLIIFFSLRLLNLPHKIRSAVYFSSMRGNVLLIGLPVISTVFGFDYLSYAVIFTMIVMPLNHILAFVLIEFDKGGPKRINLLKHIKELSKNPIIISIILGFIFWVIGIRISNIVLNSLNYLSLTTIGLALFSLGVYISGNLKMSGIKYGILSAFLKLLLYPSAVFLAVNYIFKLPPIAAQTSVIMTAMPSAVISVIVADVFNLDRDVASSAIVISSILFALTSIVWFSVL